MLKAERAGKAVGLLDLAAAMCAAVGFKDVIVEVFHAEAQTCDANVTDAGELDFIERAGFGFEGHFLRLIPRDHVLHAIGQILELRHGQVTGGAAAEVDEVRLAPLEIGLAGEALHLAHAGVDVGLNLLRILVGVDLEIAEVAAFAAERDVEINAQRDVGRGGLLQHFLHHRNLVRLPE